MDDMKPIIEMIQGQLESQIEGEVYRAVQHVGVNVDKERLLQALKDARAFWHEGYEAGRRGKPAWISVEDRLPEDGVDVLTRRAVGMSVEAHCGWGWTEDGYHTKWRVTHWMPLPEPPEVEG